MTTIAYHRTITCTHLLPYSLCLQSQFTRREQNEALWPSDVGLKCFQNGQQKTKGFARAGRGQEQNVLFFRNGATCRELHIVEGFYIETGEYVGCSWLLLHGAKVGYGQLIG